MTTHERKVKLIDVSGSVTLTSPARADVQFTFTVCPHDPRFFLLSELDWALLSLEAINRKLKTINYFYFDALFGPTRNWLKYDNVSKFLSGRADVWMPTMFFQDYLNHGQSNDALTFKDGRHRYVALFEIYGFHELPIAFPPDQRGFFQPFFANRQPDLPRRSPTRTSAGSPE